MCFSLFDRSYRYEVCVSLKVMGEAMSFEISFFFKYLYQNIIYIFNTFLKRLITILILLKYFLI